MFDEQLYELQSHRPLNTPVDEILLMKKLPS